MVDRAIAWLSPKWGYERAAWRSFQASYQGGVATRLSERFQQAQGYQFGTQGDRQQIASTRDRAYQAYDNNPVARTIIDTEVEHVISDGLNYRPSSSSVEWNREAEDRYYQWLEECSVRGPDVENGCQLQRQLWGISRVAGDVGWVLVSRGPESRIQAVRPENICTPDGMYADPAVFDGIRYDSYGAPTTFYLLSHEERTAKRIFTPIPARDFVYLPVMTKIGQARPPSGFHTVFNLLAHLDRYIDGVSLAAWMATVFGIVFKQNNGAKQLGQLGTLTNSQGVQQKAVTFENGMVKYIGTDEEVAQVQASQPMQQTPDFIRTMIRQIGAPFGMPLEVIAKDLSSCNFASARIGLLPYYRACCNKAAWFGSHWSRTIRWWLSRERQRAANDPRRWVTAFPPDYWNHDLLPNAFDYTDPVSEAQSDQLQMDMRTKSPQMVIAERGRNADRIISDWNAWDTLTAGMPVTHSQLTRDPTPEPTEPAAPEKQDTTDGNTDDTE